METAALDAEITRFIKRYLEVSGLSTATSVTQQRIDYEAMVRQFSYPHPADIRTRDSTVTGRHGDIPLRHLYVVKPIWTGGHLRCRAYRSV